MGPEPNHALGIGKASGTNKSTGETSFLDGATETEVFYYELNNGSGSSHGFVSYQASDGTLLIEFSGPAGIILVDGKPQLRAAGSWRFVRGTGRYTNGTGFGTYASKLFPPAFEGVTEWSGTFVESESQASTR